MFRNPAYKLFGVLIFGLVTTTGLRAQASQTTTDSSDTYVTTDGYGLGRILPGSITDATARARAVMIRMKIVEERRRSLGHGWVELRGKKGAKDVSIRLKAQAAATTRVEVTARRGLAEYDKDLEQEILDAIGKI